MAGDDPTIKFNVDASEFTAAKNKIVKEAVAIEAALKKVELSGNKLFGKTSKINTGNFIDLSQMSKNKLLIEDTFKTIKNIAKSPELAKGGFIKDDFLDLNSFKKQAKGITLNSEKAFETIKNIPKIEPTKGGFKTDGFLDINEFKKQAQMFGKTIDDSFKTTKNIVTTPYVDKEQLANMKLIAKETANFDKVMKALNQKVKQGQPQFAGWAMSIMFFGMGLRRMFDQVWQFGTKTFQDVMHSVEGAVTGFDHLNAATAYLGYTLGAALEPVAEWLAPIVWAIADWVTENEELVSGLIIAAGVMGTILAVGGSLKLAKDGFSTLWNIIKNLKFPVALQNIYNLLSSPTFLTDFKNIFIKTWETIRLKVAAVYRDIQAFNWTSLATFIARAIGFIAIYWALRQASNAFEEFKSGKFGQGVISSIKAGLVGFGGIKVISSGKILGMGGALIAVGVTLQFLENVGFLNHFKAFFETLGKAAKAAQKKQNFDWAEEYENTLKDYTTTAEEYVNKITQQELNLVTDTQSIIKGRESIINELERLYGSTTDSSLRRTIEAEINKQRIIILAAQDVIEEIAEANQEFSKEIQVALLRAITPDIDFDFSPYIANMPNITTDSLADSGYNTGNEVTNYINNTFNLTQAPGESGEAFLDRVMQRMRELQQ